MKLKEIIKNHEGLVKQSSKTYTAKLGYAISKNMKTFRSCIEEYEENRLKICERYAEKDEEDKPIVHENQYEMTDENKQIVNEEIKELQEVDTDIDIMKVSFAELERCENADRYDIPSVADIEDLMFMIVD